MTTNMPQFASTESFRSALNWQPSTQLGVGSAAFETVYKGSWGSTWTWSDNVNSNAPFCSGWTSDEKLSAAPMSTTPSAAAAPLPLGFTASSICAGSYQPILPPVPWSMQTSLSPISLNRTLESPIELDFQSPAYSDGSDGPPPLEGGYSSLFPEASSSTAPAPSQAGPTRTSRRTGFRGAKTALVPVDAPIQKRNYRRHSSASSPHGDEDGDESAGDEGAAKKRRQNTISARRSRLRKQQRLGELEEENASLRQELDQLRRKTAMLEARLSLQALQ